jgi:regulatory protein
MRDQGSPERRRKRAARPLNPALFEDMALAYVARFSTSGAKFERYLKRKLRERGWDGEDEPPVAATVERYIALGYIDDAAYARMKSGSLLRRGYGARRVHQALAEAGIAGALREDVAPSEAEARDAALAYARRRRFGPFGAAPVPPEQREKQLAGMLRAGHGFEAARALIDAANVAEAERWAAEAREEEES